MSEKYSYPEREHIEFPNSLIDMLAQQTEEFATSLQSSDEIVYLTQLYGERPLTQAAMYLAGLTKLSVMSNNENANKQDTLNADTNFFAGAVTAIHVNLYPLSKLKRDWILCHNPLVPLLDTSLDDDMRGQLVASLSQDMSDWHDMQGMMSHERQEPILKEKIRELSIAAYKDVANANGQDEIFINGFMFVSELIWRLDTAYIENPYSLLPKV